MHGVGVEEWHLLASQDRAGVPGSKQFGLAPPWKQACHLHPPTPPGGDCAQHSLSAVGATSLVTLHPRPNPERNVMPSAALGGVYRIHFIELSRVVPKKANVMTAIRPVRRANEQRGFSLLQHKAQSQRGLVVIMGQRNGCKKTACVQCTLRGSTGGD